MTTWPTIEAVDALDEHRARTLDPIAWSIDPPYRFLGVQPKGQTKEVSKVVWWRLNADRRRNSLKKAQSIRLSDAARGAQSVPVAHDTRKYPMLGEYKMSVPYEDEDGDERYQSVTISWDVTKKIVAGAIAASPFYTPKETPDA